MRALRLILEQTSANYKKEETVDNKMTYPLPPISTVIGALHNICGYKEYRPMDISIQGNFESMHREPYTDYCFLNSVQDDRGILVKMRNEVLLSNAFDEVAAAKKPQGNSFRKGINIQVINEKLLTEYRELKKLNDDIKDFKKKRIDRVLEKIEKRKKKLLEKKKVLVKSSNEFKKVSLREKEIKALEKRINDGYKEYMENHYKKPFSNYRTLTKSMMFYEVLDQVTLILHISAEDSVLEDIMENIYDLRSLGRSEDTVNVINAEIIELMETNQEEEIVSKYHAYINYDSIKNDIVYLRERKGKECGTKYYLNKNYIIKENKRIFEKKKVVYTSDYVVEEFGNGIYLDEYKGEYFIVDFL